MPDISVSISRKIFNDVYFPLLNDHHRRLVIYGGAGSGRSVFVAQKLIYKILHGNTNVLVLRQVGRTNRISTFPEIVKIIQNWKLSALFKINSSDLRIQCVNGGEFVFLGLDDPEKVKSVTFRSGELTDIWIEEATEITKEAFDQLNLRLRGGREKKQIIVTFNPVDINHWLYKRFFANKNDVKALTLKTTYKDNRFLDDEYRTELEGYKDTDPYYYSVYCLGNWGVYGRTIFNAQAVQDRLDCLPDPVFTGDFSYDYDGISISDIHITDAVLTHPLQIYIQPQPHKTYCVGIDTAGSGSDYSVCQVIDEAGTQCATYRYQDDAEDLFARAAFCLGSYYNNALLAPETNFSSYLVRELERLGYRNFFVRQSMDDYTGKLQKSFGFQTNVRSRSTIIAELVQFVRDHITMINNRETLNEMLTFVRNAKGRPEAQNGAHDDCIMALAIALHCRSQMDRVIVEETVNMANWTDAMILDYEHADEDLKKHIRERWKNI